MSAKNLPDLLRQLCVVLTAATRQNGSALGLQPVHVEVLRYLDRCNRYSNTPAAIADYLQMTRGTVSQSLKLLERHELIRKQSDQEDKRVVRLSLRKAGRELLQTLEGQGALEQAFQALPATLSAEVGRGVATLLEQMQALNGYRSFGVCQSCRYFQRAPDGATHCGITGEALSDGDALLICQEHELPA